MLVTITKESANRNGHSVQFLLTPEKIVTCTAHYMFNGNFNFVHNAAHGNIIIKCQMSV